MGLWGNLASSSSSHHHHPIIIIIMDTIDIIINPDCGNNTKPRVTRDAVVNIIQYNILTLKYICVLPRRYKTEERRKTLILTKLFIKFKKKTWKTLPPQEELCAPVVFQTPYWKTCTCGQRKEYIGIINDHIHDVSYQQQKPAVSHKKVQ